MGVGPLASNGNIFSISGPFHLKSIDWTNSHHRTSVASSLVNGVYTLEQDRQKKRVGSESRATPWWDFFHFTLVEPLIDDKDSIYGAIFEYKLYNNQNSPHLKVPPRYVIAFRGTILRPTNFWSDAKLDLRCMFHNFYRGNRCHHAIEATLTMVKKNRDSAIWLAGHSLGAALALLVGKKTMQLEGSPLESYIFNPPISSIPLEQLPGNKMLKNVFKGVYRISESVVKATIAMALTDQQLQEDDPETATWIPYIYVNKADPICAEYIGYFKHKTFMSKIGASIIERVGARISVRSLLVGFVNGTSSPSDSSTEPLHLLPSADMIVNKNKPTKSKIKAGFAAHRLQQWWEPDSALRGNWESCSIRPNSEIWRQIGKAAGCSN